MAKGDEKKPAGAGQAQPPEAGQQVQQAESKGVTVVILHETVMTLAESLRALGLRVDELEAKLAAIGEPGLMAAMLNVVTEPQIEFDPAWLEGLVFKGSRLKADVGNIHDPFERAARRSDVLKWSVRPDEVIIVLADGSKHQVKR